MKGIVHRVSVVLGLVALLAGVAVAQVPGDNLPDVYYFQGDGGVANTSMGPISLPAGTITIDTDGKDMVAFFFGGPNVFPPFGGSGCALCDGMNLPGSDAVAGSSTWTSGYSAMQSQWIRTNPLITDGFRGVIGVGFLDGSDVQQPWPADVLPFLNFPDANAGIANVGAGLTEADFLKVVGPPGMTNLFNFEWAEDNGFNGFTNITIVPPIPEPAAAGLLALGCLGMLGLRKRG